MNRNKLVEQIRKKKSVLCVGLDTDLKKIPDFLIDADDPQFEFNKRIIDATHEFAVAFKPNLAFYECEGLKGWHSLEKTVQYLRKNYPDHFTIADAKRGDIGNTSEMYARAFFDQLHFDSVTVAPYMGEDSVKPFLRENKWVIVLALTSNRGAYDFQTLEIRHMTDAPPEEKLFQRVLKTTSEWGNPSNMMYVVGATKASLLKDIRAIVPDHFLLVPGVGAQGGSLEDVMKNGLNADGGLLINASRSIIYASTGPDFEKAAFEEAQKMQQEMAVFL